MSRDKLFVAIKLCIIIPIFVVLVVIWAPCMIIKDVLVKSAHEVNSFFDNTG